MVRFQDFLIAGLLGFMVITAAGLIVGDANRQYPDANIDTDSGVDLDKLNKTFAIIGGSYSNLTEQQSELTGGLAQIFTKPIAVAQGLTAALSVSGEIITSIFDNFGIPAVFGWIVGLILVVIFIFLFIAMLTGRFV